MVSPRRKSPSGIVLASAGTCGRGTMDRPGLKRLLKDIEAGKIDVIVVYKVDRLTRSLSDFAKIVDVLDARHASFVSITQSFNTTTSMGRLTLNVLLSFAQFEREVTGERIRDKIAASKKKGMWMGGPVPLGYEVQNRKLIVDEADAAVVRHLFTRYMALGSGQKLLEELREQGYRTKLRKLRSGQVRGGVPFSRGMLFSMLSNRIYFGEMVHKGEAHPGEHEPIVDQELWAGFRTDCRQSSRAARALQCCSCEPARRRDPRPTWQAHVTEPCRERWSALPLLHHPLSGPR